MPRPALVRAAVVDGSWVVTLGDAVTDSMDSIVLGRGADAWGAPMIRAELVEPGLVHWVDDTDLGDKVAVVPLKAAPRGILRTQSFVDFNVLASAHGLAVNPLADDVVVATGLDDVTISRPRGLALSSTRASTAKKMGTANPSVIQRDIWSDDRKGHVRERMRDLATAAAEAHKSGRTEARLRLARFQLANGLGEETAGLLDVIAADDQERGSSREVRILASIANIFANRLPTAATYVAASPTVNDPEMDLWRAYIDARQRRWPAAMSGFRQAEDILEGYPDHLKGIIGPAFAEAAIESGDIDAVGRAMDLLQSIDTEYLPKDLLAFLSARRNEMQGQSEEAAEAYEALSRSSDRIIQARAIVAGAALAMAKPDYDRSAILAHLESLATSWRGDHTEIQTLALLGRLYGEQERWRDVFGLARLANELFPQDDLTRALGDDASKRFESVFLDGKGDSIPRLDALALYFDFKEFTPPGRRGDEMIRRLADRLVSLDLLDEASDLLQYQVDNRLTGAAKAAVGSRLAVLHLVNRQPSRALQTLRSSRTSELPADAKRSRALLEARALSELSRGDLAIDLIAAESGPDVERLRADILWRSRNWRAAGEQYERMVGDAWKRPEPLSAATRADVMRAALAFVLSDDPLSLERLRGKLSPRWPTARIPGPSPC